MDRRICQRRPLYRLRHLLLPHDRQFDPPCRADRARGPQACRALRVSQRHPTAQRLGLLLCVFWSFIFGAAAGAWMQLHFAAIAMVPPVAFVAGIIVLDLWKPIAGVKELDLLSDPELRAYGIVK